MENRLVRGEEEGLLIHFSEVGFLNEFEKKSSNFFDNFN